MITTEILLALANAIVVALVGWMVAKFKEREAKHDIESKKRDEEYEGLKCGMRSILADRISQSTEYFTAIGGITISQMKQIENLYTSYHNLNGNGTITALYKKAMALPIITDHEFHKRSRGCVGEGCSNDNSNQKKYTQTR